MICAASPPFSTKASVDREVAKHPWHLHDARSFRLLLVAAKGIYSKSVGGSGCIVAE